MVLARKRAITMATRVAVKEEDDCEGGMSNGNGNEDGNGDKEGNGKCQQQ
jgi:hypothetical protein